MSTRIYLVTEKDGTRHLVRSTVPAQAVAHIARDQFGVRVATQDDLISCMQDGIAPQSALPEPAAAPVAANPLPPQQGLLGND